MKDAADTGRVRSVENCDITSLSTHYQTGRDGMLAATNGIHFKTGAVRATYDWYPESIKMLAPK